MRTLSKDAYERACKVIPGGVNSPARSFKGLGIDPVVVESGKGDLICDIDGVSYIDFCGSWGALILGHAHPQVVHGVIEQVKKGSSFGTMTAVEEKLASLVIQSVPFLEKLRFVNSGTEATMSAMRLARGVTRRAKIVKFSGHYHGHSDSLLIQAGSSVAMMNPIATSKGVNPGVIADTICIPFNDEKALTEVFQRQGDEIAAVIVEPIAGNMGVVLPKEGFLAFLKEKTSQYGALLIFDEVMSGFRVALGGASSFYQIEPDLVCFGKVIGGGFPVAAIGGRAALLDHFAPLGEVYQAGTLSGNPVAMRAGIETLQIIRQPHFYEELEKKARRLIDPIQKHIQKNHLPCLLQHQGSMLTLFFGVQEVFCKEDLLGLDEKMFARFFSYLFERGIYIPPSSHEAWFISSVHTDEHIDQTVDAVLSFLKREYL